MLALWNRNSTGLAAGVDQVRQSFLAIADQGDDLTWVDNLVQLAIELLVLYGTDTLDYHLLQQEVCRDQRWLTALEAEADVVWRESVRLLYRQLHPSRNLETLYGVGEKGAAVFASFIGRAERFPNNRKFRGWPCVILYYTGLARPGPR